MLTTQAWGPEHGAPAPCENLGVRLVQVCSPCEEMETGLLRVFSTASLDKPGHFWFSRRSYGGLNEKCPSVHRLMCLNTESLVCGSVWGGYRTFSIWRKHNWMWSLRVHSLAPASSHLFPAWEWRCDLSVSCSGPMMPHSPYRVDSNPQKPSAKIRTSI